MAEVPNLAYFLDIAAPVVSHDFDRNIPVPAVVVLHIHPPPNDRGTTE